jgi:hypothetical protein
VSTDAVKRIDEARQALRETVQRLAEIADGLRGEPELPPEPPIGSVVIHDDISREDPWGGTIYRRDIEGWFTPGGIGYPVPWKHLCSGGITPVLLVRADQTVVLPSEFRDPVTVMSGKRSLAATTAGPELHIEVSTDDYTRWRTVALLAADAERWLLETLALVRSKGGAS